MIRRLWREALRRSGLREILDRARSQSETLDGLARRLAAIEEADAARAAALAEIAREVRRIADTEEPLANATSLLLRLHERATREGELQVYAGYEPAELAVLHRYADTQRKPEPGFLVDFMGIRTRASDLWEEARTAEGTLLPWPVPGDFHAEAAEWIAVLSAVDRAENSFAMMELGAGWGPWLVAAATACRRRGIVDPVLVGVEPDARHFESMRRHFQDNGFDPDRVILLRAAVGASAGRAHLSAARDNLHDYGRRLLSCQAGDNTSEEVPLIDVNDLLRRAPIWDLVHVDIQGIEADVIAHGLEELTARVKTLVVGTHSRAIEGRLFELLRGAGWRLEREKPCRFAWRPDAPDLETMTVLDGIQAWRNPRLTSPLP